MKEKKRGGLMTMGGSSLLTAFAMLCLAACGNAQSSGDIAFTAGGAQDSTQGTQKSEETEGFYFMSGDVMITPGMTFDADTLPAENVYQVPSCAFEGTDNVYSYGSYEITAFNDGEKELVYSIFFVEPDVSTPEGLANGDDLAKAKELYGDYKEDDAAWIFTRGNTELYVIGEEDVIVSIEIRLIY